MASKALYTAVAALGIVVASGTAWWLQQPKSSAATGVDASVSPPPAVAASAGGTAMAGKDKPVTVEAARVEVARLSDETQAVGSLRSRRGVVLRPEVSGRITQLNFADGQRVRKGQVLVQFDDQLQLAQMQQSMAELSIAEANQRRNQELVAENFVSRRALDESAANLQVAQARLSLARATAARLKIVAPFDGIAGIRLVNAGDYLKDGADIVNIEDIEAVYVDFRLPERFQSKLQRGQTALLDIDALPGRKYTAQIQAIDPLIDANGRSVGVRACVDNRALQLRPGMFARVNTVFGVRENARVIPEEAIVPQGGRQYVVKLMGDADAKTRTTQRVEVKVGLRSPGRVEILQGLEAGDTVVTAGQQRAQRDGTLVTVVDLNKRAGGQGVGVAGAAGAGGPPVTAPAAATSAAAAANAPAAASTGASAGKPLPVAAKPQLAGPNPCNVAIPGVSAGAMPAVQPPAAAPAARSPA